MKQLLSTLLIILPAFSFCQKTTTNQSLLKQLGKNACDCIESISSMNKSKNYVSREIHKCINEQVGAFQLGSLLFNIDTSNATKMADGKKNIEIAINNNPESNEFKNYYFTMERYLMENCKALKMLAASNDKLNENSLSSNEKALTYYTKGQDASKKENYKNAIKNYQKAVEIDPQFVFAWDNMGICYRKMGDYDMAIDCYQKSLSIDSTGAMPLQNIAVAYLFKKEYQKALDAYQRLSALDSSNPEIYYGMGQVYAINLGEYEKGLVYLCKAYNLYLASKSPYRTDAEKLINMVFTEMKKQGKEEQFLAILAENNITPN